MRSPVLLLILLAATMPACAQDKKDIPDPVCDGGTPEMVACLAAATAKWDKRLNAAYRDALKEAPAAQREPLRKAQRLWLQYRDANCEYYALGEGSIARLNAGSCLFDLTKSRAQELERGPRN